MARRIIMLAVALCAASALAGTTPVGAHTGNPSYESLVRSVTPALGGLTVQVLNGDDRLLVTNATTRTIRIAGYQREPYIRMSPDGEVAVNVRSPAYWLNKERQAGAPVPARADSSARPEWQVVARSGRFEFHDHRMHWMGTTLPPQVGDRSQRTKINDWSVPLTADDATGAIRGELFWRGGDGGPPLGAFVGLGLIVVLGAASVVVVRRRRRAAGRPPAARGEAW